MSSGSTGNISPLASMPTPSPEAKPDISSTQQQSEAVLAAAAQSGQSPTSLNSLYSSFYSKTALPPASLHPAMHPGMNMMTAAAAAAAGSVPATSLAAFSAYPSAGANSTTASYPLPSLDQLRRPVGVLI